MAQNFKGALQEHFAKNGSGITPEYGVVRRDGLDHSPTFTCYVRIGNRGQAEGTARAKKDAEQEAARNMMQQLGLIQGQASTHQSREPLNLEICPRRSRTRLFDHRQRSR